MNILMLGRCLPPPRRAVRSTREYHFARHLARTHRLTLAFITDNPDAAGAISALRSDFGDLEFAVVPRTWKSLSSALRLVTGESCTLSYFRSEALRTRLADRLKRARYDLVLVSSSSMIQYALEIDPTIPMVMDFAGVDSEWWVRQAAPGTFGASRFFRTEATRLRLAETAAARRAVRCVVETSAAGEIVRSFAPGVAAAVIPDGVAAEGADAMSRGGKVPTVVLHAPPAGKGDLDETFVFCRAILLALRARVPEVRLVVTSGESIATWPSGVEVASPATDVRLLFHSHTVAVAPMMTGADIRRAVLEPMAAGVPVVTNSQTCAQIEGGPGRDLGVADGPDDFVGKVIELLENRGLREELGAQGRRFVQANFSWEASAVRFEAILSAVANGGAHRANGSSSQPMPATLGG
jgi:hypothetical protein